MAGNTVADGAAGKAAVGSASRGRIARLVRRARTMLLLALATPVVLAVRVIRPVVLVRFGALKSSRIGHFALDTELHLGERETRMHGRRMVDVFYHASDISNGQLRKMWDRVLRVSPFVRYLDRVSRRLPGGGPHTVTLKSWRNGTRDVYNLLSRTPTHLSFTTDEGRHGEAALRELGIPEHSRFVCFHARDSAFLSGAHRGAWDYHDYRDSSIQHYIPAAQALADRGYFAVRMGATVKEPLGVDIPNILDYAARSRTEFLDIYLSAKCTFFISSGTGIDQVAEIFRRPVVYVNFLPLERIHSWSPNYLVIPKKLWLEDERRFMSFREIIDTGAGRYLRSEDYERSGIRVVENSPEEITALAVEMDERLNGSWVGADEDEELQRRFWSLFESSELHGEIESRIGAAFLRENRDLLE